MITTTAQLRSEFAKRAVTNGLDIECPCDGTFNSQIAVIAEAPGDNEVAKKMPLIGPSGHKLWTTMRQFGISRMDCYITNVAKRQVSFGDDKRRPISKPEQEQWSDLLLWELSQLPNLKYVVALGNFALQALTQHTGITKWRGSVLPVTLSNGRTVQVICTYNPAMILREPKTEITFQLDISKLKRVMNGKFKLPVIHTHINPSFQDARDWIRKMRSDGLPVAWDIETKSNETACVGYANSIDEAMCINWRDMDKNRYTLEQERILRRDIQRLHSDKSVKFVTQNGMFDTTWYGYKDGIQTHAVWFDTMLAHHTLYPALPHNLGFLTTQYTDHPYYKDEKDDWKDVGDIDNFWRYNGKDCCLTLMVHLKELRELEKQNLKDFFFDHVMRLHPHLARMTIGGVRIDTDLKDSIREKLIEDCAVKLSEFHNAVKIATGLEEYTPNPKSPAQLGELFFRKLKLVGRGTSTNADNRKRMFDHPRTSVEAKEVIQKLDGYLKEHKFLTTYAEMEIDPDGRARSEYKQTGVQSAPGRLSSSKVMWGSGMNFQNQPSRAYPMFIADDGFGIGYFDAAQAEARLVACFADIDLWKEQFERARIDGAYDAHRALASEMFNLPYADIPTADEITHDDGSTSKSLRYIAKRCRHGLNYRMGPDRLAQTTGLSLGESYKAYNAYHRATPEIKMWWHNIEKEVRDTKQLFNAFGRRWQLLERLSPEALESIVAFKPQSTLGDHICRVIYKCHEDDRWPLHARIWMNVHDALLCIAPLDKVKTCVAIMKEHAETPIPIKGYPLIIPADLKIGIEPDESGKIRWSTLKKWKPGEE